MNPLTPLIAVALLAATVKTVTDFPAYIAARQWSPVLKQMVGWGAGVAGAFVLAASDLGATIQATETVTLADANRWTVAVFGFALGSGAGLVHQYLQAKDGTQTAAVPPYVQQPLPMGAQVHDYTTPAVAEAVSPSAPTGGAVGVSIPTPQG